MTPALLGGWLLVALAGFGIGATSIGGVLVVPALTALVRVDLPGAIAASSLAFLVTGLLALASAGRGWRATLRPDAVLLIAALAGALAGAALTTTIPGAWIRAWIGVLALVSGLFGLWRLRAPASHEAGRAWPGPLAQAGLGLVVGAGSALSGTGGPVMLLPWLLLTGRPLLRAVALAQVLQVPIALAATAAHAAAGRIDWLLGAGVAGVLIAGAWAGRRAARRIPPRPLNAGTATLLIATGLWFLLT